MDLKGKYVAVIGLADSGVAAVKFLAQRGAKVAATDTKSETQIDALEEVRSAGARVYAGGHPESLFREVDLVVTSPGVPKNAPPILAAQERGVPVISELEMAARHIAAPIVAVTGTNGKSTVVSLIGEIMARALGKEKVFVGGNIGTPLAELLLEKRQVDAAVVEVSSFQLEFAPEFSPRVAVVLNITDDHLDRYSGFKDYADTKWNIFANQGKGDVAIVNIDDPEIEKRAASLKAMVLNISLQQKREPGMWLEQDRLVYRGPGAENEELPVASVPLHGKHNLMNVMAAYCAARAMDVSPEVIKTALVKFKGLAHRLELVKEKNGVKFFNDSKATNAGAVLAAVSGLDLPVILIMGGQAKGCSFAELAERIKDRAKTVVAFGECREQLEREMADKVPVVSVETMEMAIDKALQVANFGDAVILAPGCASFDQFESYKHRGEIFRRMVMEKT